MKREEYTVGPYLIRKKTLHYGVRPREQRESLELGIKRKKASGGVLKSHYTVLLNGETVNSFLDLGLAKKWCRENMPGEQQEMKV